MILEWSFILAAGFYLTGLARNWRKAGWGHGVRTGQALAFLAAITVTWAALASPLDALVDRFFTAHMFQHMLLILVAAPLYVVSAIPEVYLWALPRRWSNRLANFWGRTAWLRAAWSFLSGAGPSWALFTGMIWLWHLPTLYQAALRSEAIHALEHICFLITAMLFWWFVLRPARKKEIHSGAVILYLFISMLQMSALGAILAFASRPWYPMYLGGSRLGWQLSTLADQQAAGMVMWLPGGILFLILIALYFIYWMNALDQRMPGEEMMGEIRKG